MLYASVLSGSTKYYLSEDYDKHDWNYGIRSVKAGIENVKAVLDGKQEKEKDYEWVTPYLNAILESDMRNHMMAPKWRSIEGDYYGVFDVLKSLPLLEIDAPKVWEYRVPPYMLIRYAICIYPVTNAQFTVIFTVLQIPFCS